MYDIFINDFINCSAGIMAKEMGFYEEFKNKYPELEESYLKVIEQRKITTAVSDFNI